MLVIYLEGEEWFRFEPAPKLAGLERRFMEQMDEDMARGIELDGRRIASPDAAARNQYVIGQLLMALEAGEPKAASVMCAYLSDRWPSLKAIYVRESEGEFEVELETSSE